MSIKRNLENRDLYEHVQIFGLQRHETYITFKVNYLGPIIRNGDELRELVERIYSPAQDGNENLAQIIATLCLQGWHMCGNSNHADGMAYFFKRKLLPEEKQELVRNLTEQTE
ncbi:MAG: hypothetical protein AAFQ07_14940 [Chloroflexota bacterium]